jgi:hypothetical protein
MVGEPSPLAAGKKEANALSEWARPDKSWVVLPDEVEVFKTTALK